jgi:hypothetical protein
MWDILTLCLLDGLLHGFLCGDDILNSFHRAGSSGGRGGGRFGLVVRVVRAFVPGVRLPGNDVNNFDFHHQFEHH